MRQLLVQVKPGDANRVLALAGEHRAVNSVALSAHDGDSEWDYVVLHVANREVGPLLAELEKLEEMHVTLVPHSVMPMQPPESKVADQIHNVTTRSPVEVWLNGLQSVGSWKGFLGYAAAASVVVWIGMLTGTIYLLVAAMLIAPFAGPAMNSALASATGDHTLLLRNVTRYFVSLGLMIVLTAFLSVLFKQSTATGTMVSVSQLSVVAALLPLTAGAAGALNLVQAENSSLVAGTAVGLLIAASLAPPAALVGMSVALQRWDLAYNGVFTLLLQLAGINLSGALVFRAYGLRPSSSRYSQRGSNTVFYWSVAVSAVALAGMIYWQVSDPPKLQRASRAQQALDLVGQVIGEGELAELVEANVRFTRPSADSSETLLGVIYVTRKPGVELGGEALAAVLVDELQANVLEQGFNVTPLFEVVVLEEPPEGLSPPADP